MHIYPSDGNASFLRAARAGNLEKLLEYLKGSIDINTSNANGLNALHLASKEGHVAVVAELVKRGANANAATKKGNTALHIASLAGQEEVVKILLRNGANVNVQSQNGFTPLYMAAQENHDGVVRFLLANGANQSLATEDGFTPLAVALQQGRDKVVAVLLENDAKGRVKLPALHIAAKKDDCKAAALLLQNDHDPDVTSKSGFTPLHIAAHYGNENIGSLLLEKNADVNYAAKHQITPLHVAAKWGKSNMVTLLLNKGAKKDASTRDGLTPLHCAARSGHDQVVDLLLERGAPITAKTKNGLAPLHMASQGDHVDSSRILLYHKAPVDDVTVDYLTALHVAAHCGHVRVAKLLLDRKADPNARALNGFTPLHIACKKNRIKVVELLLKHGASIEATTESGLTPLHVASFMGCMNIVIYLIQHGANPDVPTVRGETPLHLAARANQSDIIRILLRNGAHVDAAAREQQTPLHIAARLGNVDIVGLLLQHGAAVDSTTKDMYTALHIAAKEGQEEVASVLLDHGASLTSTTKKGFTPLHLAAKYGNIKVARLLLQKDAPVDAQGKNGVTPLHVAAHYDHVNVALLLLDKGAFPHATAKNGYTPLHIAAKKNQMDIATTLLEYGAKPSAESKAGFSPLHLASQEGHTDMTTLLIEHHADVSSPAKNGLTPLHLCAQEDRVNVAAILVKNGAPVDPPTKAGYTPLHVACHFGQINMIRFLLQHGADVNATTSHGYTPLHQAAQQGHTLIINLLLEHKASPNTTTNQGQTALSIAQRLGYISVVETLKIVTETVVTTTTTTITEEKYKVVAPETMQETFMSDSEDEGAEETMLGDQSFKYLTADEMKSLGDDSLPIDVTRDERGTDSMLIAPPTADEEHLTPQHIVHQETTFSTSMVPDNVDIARAPVHAGFLVSFMVDARGGAMRGCRHSGVRVIIPPRKASMPMRITCRYLRKEKLAHPPPLMEGEACASRILEVGPAGAKFLGPVIIEVPHFASLRGREREITILRSDNGETWREHNFEASEDTIHDVFNESFEGEDLTALDDLNTNRITRILTTDFPQYFAIITRIRQEVHGIGSEGGIVSSTVVPQVQALFPEGALTKKIKVGLQAHPITPEQVTKLLGNRVAVSPIVTVEPRRRKFHKPITLTIPVPQAATKGMINQYSGDAPTLRLLCSVTGSTKTGGTTKAQWEDVTGSTPLTFVNDCVTFTTTISARFWLIDCRQVNEATKFATELYREAVHVPFMAKFVVFAKRHDPMEAQLRVFCMTDDKEDKTLECQEHFTEVAKSRDVEVLEGKSQFLEFVGNLVPVTKSGEQLKLTFQAFRENRLPFVIRVKDPHQEPLGRVAFMREQRVGRGEPPQTPICNLNISLPEAQTSPVSELVTLEKKYGFVEETSLAKPELIHRADLRLSDIAKALKDDWVPLALQLDIPESDINAIRSECVDDHNEQALRMLRLWLQRAGNKATGNSLEKGLRKINREDIVNQCMFNVELVTDDVEKAVAKVHLDQSGFDTFKEELGSSRDASLRRETSFNGTYDERDIMKEAESAAETSSEGSEKETHFAAGGEAQRAERESLEDALADQIVQGKQSLSEEISAVNHHEAVEAVTSETYSQVSSNQRFTQSSCHDEEISDQTSATISSETAAEFEISSGEDKPEIHTERREVLGSRTPHGVLENVKQEDAPGINPSSAKRNLHSASLKEVDTVSRKYLRKSIDSPYIDISFDKQIDAAKRSAIKKSGPNFTPKKVTFVSHSQTLSPVPRRKRSLVVRRNSWPPVSVSDQGNKKKRHQFYLKKKFQFSYFYKMFPDEFSLRNSSDWLEMKAGPEISVEAPLAGFDEFQEFDVCHKPKSLLLSNIPCANTKWSADLSFRNNIPNFDKCLKFYFKPKWHIGCDKQAKMKNSAPKCEISKGINEFFKGKNGLSHSVDSSQVTNRPHYNAYPKIIHKELQQTVTDKTARSNLDLLCGKSSKIGRYQYPVAAKMKCYMPDSVNEYDLGPVCVSNVPDYDSNIINNISWNTWNVSKKVSEIPYIRSYNGGMVHSLISDTAHDIIGNTNLMYDSPAYIPTEPAHEFPLSITPIRVSSSYRMPRNNRVISEKSSVTDICNSPNNICSQWGTNGFPQSHTGNTFNDVARERNMPSGFPSFNSPVQPVVNPNTAAGKYSTRPVDPTTPSGTSSTRPVSNPATKPSGQTTDGQRHASQPSAQLQGTTSSHTPSGPAENPTDSSNIQNQPTEGGKSEHSPPKPADVSKEKKNPKEGKEAHDSKSEAVHSTMVAQTFLKTLLEQAKLEEEESTSKPIPATAIGHAFLKTLAEQSYEPQQSESSPIVPAPVVGQVFLKSLIEQTEEQRSEVPKTMPASVIGQAFLKTLQQQSEVKQEGISSEETESKSSAVEHKRETPSPIPSTIVGQAFLKILFQENQKTQPESAPKAIPATVVGQAFLKTLVEDQTKQSETTVPASVVGQSFLKSLLERSDTVGSQGDQPHVAEAVEKPQAIPSSVVGQAFLKTLMQESKQTGTEVDTQESQAEKTIPASVVGQAFLKTLVQEGSGIEPESKPLPSTVVGQVFLKTLMGQAGALVGRQEPKESEKPSTIPASVLGQAFLKTLSEKSEVSSQQQDDPSAQVGVETSIPASVVGQTFLKSLLQQSELAEISRDSSVHQPVPAPVVGQAFLKTLMQQTEQSTLSESQSQSSDDPVPSSVVGQVFLKSLLQLSEVATAESLPSEKEHHPVPATAVGQVFLKTLLQESKPSTESQEAVEKHPIPAPVLGQTFLKTLIQESELQSPETLGSHEKEKSEIPASVVGQAFLKTLLQQSESIEVSEGAQQRKVQQPISSGIVGQAFLKTLIQQSQEGSSQHESELSQSDKSSQSIPAPVVGQSFLKTLLLQAESVDPASSTEESKVKQAVPSAAVGQAFLKTLLQQSQLAESSPDPEHSSKTSSEPIPAPVVGQAFLKSLIRQTDSVEAAPTAQESDVQHPVPSAVVGQAFLKTLLQQAESVEPASTAEESKVKHAGPSTVVGQAFLKTLFQQSQLDESSLSESEHSAKKSSETIPAPVVGHAFLKSLMQQAEPVETATSAQESEVQRPVPSAVVGQAFLKTLFQQSQQGEQSSSDESHHSGKENLSPPVPASAVGQAFLRTLIQQTEQDPVKEIETQHTVPSAVIGQAFLKTLLQQSPQQETSPATESKQLSEPVPASVVGQAFLKTLLQESAVEESLSPASKPVPSAVVGQTFLKTLMQQSKIEEVPVEGDTLLESEVPSHQSSKPIPSTVVGQSFLKSLFEQTQEQPGGDSSHAIPASVVGQAFLKTLIQQPAPPKVQASSSVLPASVVGQTFLQMLTRQVSGELERSKVSCVKAQTSEKDEPMSSKDLAPMDQEGKRQPCSSGKGCVSPDLPHSSGNVCNNEECISSVLSSISVTDEMNDMSVKEELCMMKNICDNLISGFSRFHTENSKKTKLLPQNADHIPKQLDSISTLSEIKRDESSSYRCDSSSKEDGRKIAVFPENFNGKEHDTVPNDVGNHLENNYASSPNAFLCSENILSDSVSLQNNISKKSTEYQQNVPQVVGRVSRRASKASDRQSRTSAEIRGMIFDVWKITEELQDIVGNLDDSFGLSIQKEIVGESISCSGVSEKSGFDPAVESSVSLSAVAIKDTSSKDNEIQNSEVPPAVSEDLIVDGEVLLPNAVSDDGDDAITSYEAHQDREITECEVSLDASENLLCNGYNRVNEEMPSEAKSPEEHEHLDASEFSIVSAVPCEVVPSGDESPSLFKAQPLYEEKQESVSNGNYAPFSVARYLNELQTICNEGKSLLKQLSLQIEKESCISALVATNGSQELSNATSSEIKSAPPASKDIPSHAVDSSVSENKGYEKATVQDSELHSEHLSKVSDLRFIPHKAETELHEEYLPGLEMNQSSLNEIYSVEESSHFSETLPEFNGYQQILNEPHTTQQYISEGKGISKDNTELSNEVVKWNISSEEESLPLSEIFLPPPEFRNTPDNQNENDISSPVSDSRFMKMEAILSELSLGSINELLGLTDLMQNIIETMVDPM